MQSVCVFLLTLHAVASSVFFHELSSIDLEPSNSSDASFGTSLAYQGGGTPRVLVGAPRYDDTGRVYQCPLVVIKDAATKHMPAKCQALDINLDAMGVEYSRKYSSDQKFYLGASIAATEDFFLTCAPLRTAFLEADRFFGAYGICFIYKTGKATPWTGPGREMYLEEGKRHKRKIIWSDEIYGGHGWATLVDEVYGRLIVTKSFTKCDAYVGNISAPYSEFYSLVESGNLPEFIVGQFRSYGQAMTLGNYFDTEKENMLYAINIVYETAQGGFQLIDSKSMEPVYDYTDNNVGNMFGSSLASADVTGDARADLLVGEPAHAENDACWDRGALHIFTATSDRKAMELKLTIRGTHDGARFATSLAAYDVNWDSYPEIIVGAPEESVVYVLCGYEIFKMVTQKGHNNIKIDVSDLSSTQEIKKASYKRFGLSLQPIIDFDDNGRKDLLVGAPDQSKVTLFKGIPSITVEVTSRISDQTASVDFAYVVSSCVKVRKPEKMKKITTKLLVENVLNGNDARFQSGDTKFSYVADLSNRGTLLSDGREEYCKELNIKSTTVCTITTKVSPVEDITKLNDFSNTWVMLSKQSTTAKSITLTCSCTGTEGCKPLLVSEFHWSGNQSNYVVGSSRDEDVSIAVHNSWSRACTACVHVRVRGAAVAQLRCDWRSGGYYLCYLPSPFNQNADETIDLKLRMDVSSQNENLEIEVNLKKNCEEPEETNNTLVIPYIFSEDLVSVQGSGFNYSLSDFELQNEDEETLIEEQTYTITTTESVTWENVQAKITLEKASYIQNLQVSVASKPAKKCEDSKELPRVGLISYCWLTLPPNSTVDIVVRTAVIKKEIKNHMKDWAIAISSKLELDLLSNLTKYHTVTTVIMLQKQAIGQNKNLVIIIGILVGVILLALLSFILYKVGFFKRKKQEELKEIKKEFRRRSTIRDKTASQSSHGRDANSQCDMEDLVIVEESPFDDPSPAEQLASAAPVPNDKKSSQTVHNNKLNKKIGIK